MGPLGARDPSNELQPLAILTRMGVSTAIPRASAAWALDASRNFELSPSPLPNFELVCASEFNSASTTTLVESNLVDMAAVSV